MDKKRLTGRTARRTILAVLCALAAIVPVLAATRTVQAQQQSVPAIQTDPPLPTRAAASEMPQLACLLAEVEFERNSKTVNILLVGSDDTEEAGARSDTMILCSFNRKDNTITMTSFLRDLYVNIPGYGKNRINAAYSFGGVDLLRKTLKENFAVEVDGSIQVDFSCFESIIDLLGGVTMELTAAEAAFINKRVEGSALTAGTHLLTGRQALMYARNRYDKDGDFSRTNRQRKLLQVMVDTCKHKRLTQMLRLMRELVPMVKTDIAKSDLTGYAMTLLPMLTNAEIRTQAIPVADGYRHAKIDGRYVLVPDLEKNKQALADLLE